MPGTVQHVISFLRGKKKCLVKNGRPLGVLILELESEVFLVFIFFMLGGWVDRSIDGWAGWLVGLGWLDWETGDWMVESGGRGERVRGGEEEKGRKGEREEKKEGRASHSRPTDRPTDRCALRSSLSLLALPPPSPST